MNPLRALWMALHPATSPATPRIDSATAQLLGETVALRGQGKAGTRWLSPTLGRGTLWTERGRTERLSTPEVPPDEALVRQARQAAGISGADGRPVGVHLVLQGAGSRALRYPPAFAELVELGIVPRRVTGTSAGAIFGALVAAGAGPAKVVEIYKNLPGRELLDFHANPLRGGLLKGERLHDYLDGHLREITGITHRPVTFADLKLPLEVVATKMSDSVAPGGSRRFVFSTETTPDTSVALALRASAAVPGFYDAVKLVDPFNGRVVQLADGALVDNFPVALADPGLPVLGLSVQKKGFRPPKEGPLPAMPEGNIPAERTVAHLRGAAKILASTGTRRADFLERTEPAAGHFVLTLPAWDLARGGGNSFFQLKAGAGDAAMDVQTRAVVRDFLAKALPRMSNPKASATNALRDFDAFTP